MLYLAQVQKNPNSGESELYLLAYQQENQQWSVLTPEKLPYPENDLYLPGNLVLIDLGENQQILTIQNAKDWVIELVKKYLSHPPLTSEWIEKEIARIEQGRQEITAKSLDLTRRQLELETQREQVQELETHLKQEQAKLEKRQQETEK